MSTDAGFAEHVCDQLRAAGGITAKKMFGEYGIYRHGKIVALACDNQLFVKATSAGAALLAAPTYGAPYPGAKPHFNVSELLDDAGTLVHLIVATDDALPAPRLKTPAKTTAKKTAKTTAKKTAKTTAKTTAKKR